MPLDQITTLLHHNEYMTIKNKTCVENIYSRMISVTHTVYRSAIRQTDNIRDFLGKAILVTYPEVH